MTEEGQHRAEAASVAGGEPFASALEPNSIDVVALLRKLRPNSQKISLIALAVFAVAGATAYLIPPRYTSMASFIPPNASNVSGASAIAGQVAQLSGLSTAGLLSGTRNPGDLYVGILRSRSIANQLIKRFDLMRVYRVRKESQAAKILASRTTFAVGTKDSIVTIAVADSVPARARDLASGYLDALRDINGRLALTESSQRRVFFGQQLEKEKNDLEDAEVELKKTEEQSGLIAPAGQTATEIQIIAQTRAQISARQVELAALRQSATEQNTEVIRLQTEIKDLEDQLSRLQAGGVQRASAAIPTSRFPQLDLEYVRKEREVKYHEALFAMLSNQYEGARIDEAHEAPLIQVLDSPSYPDSKSWPPRLMIMIGGLIFGALAGCAWILLQERMDAFRAALAAPEAAESTMKEKAPSLTR